MKTSEQINELAEALSKAQGMMKSIPRGSKVTIKTKSGASYSYDYSTLDDVIDHTRSPLSENGLSIVQVPSFSSAGLSLTTRLLHSSGQWIECEMEMKPNDNDIKTLGGLITYFRRYSYTAMVGVASEEDTDAPNTTAQPQDKKAQPKPAQEKDSAQAQALKAFYDEALSSCGLEPEPVREICKALKISYDPSKAKAILTTLCKEVESPSCMPSLIAAANKATKNYYNRSDKFADNVYHVKGSIKKLHPDFVWPTKPGNPKEWAEALIFAIQYAEDNKSIEDDELSKHLDEPEQPALVDVPSEIPEQEYE